jgi:ribosomal protein S18 acetylase RimI-like enzyme
MTTSEPASTSRSSFERGVSASWTTARYRTMRLDTSVRQEEAQAPYRRMGFHEIPPYYELPQDLRDWLVFMEMPLRE